VTRSTRLRIRYVALGLFAIPWVVVPAWLMIVSSFKTRAEATELSLSIPRRWNIVENYRTVFSVGGYPGALRNSVLIVLPTILVVIFVGSFTAWAFARSRSIGMKVAYNVTVLSILLPAALLPTIYLLDTLGMRGTRLGYILVTIGMRLGLVIFLATGFLRAFPRDMEEAAAIDGANRAQIYRFIVVPMLSPVLFVGAVLLVIGVWNEFFFASFLLPKPDQATLPIALYRFATAGTTQVTYQWQLIFAHVVMTSLPLIAVYLIAQRRVLAGLTEGGVKG
jgi:raffinose/stachyose/melibiose transport system permease protein